VGKLIALATCSNLPSWEVDDRALVEALSERGCAVDVIPWDVPAEWGDYDACLIRTTWDYSERLAEFLAWAHRVAEATRLFNPEPLIEWNARKGYLLELEQAGAPVIPTVWLDPGGAPGGLAAALRRQGWERAFLKPQVGASARLTLPFDSSADGLAAAEALLAANPRESWLLQPFLARVLEEGEVSAIFVDGELSHGVRKTPVAGDYRVQDDYGARDEPWEPTSAELELCRKIVGLIPGPWLYARVDLLRDDHGQLVLTELELIEPSLFFRHDATAADRLAAALLRRLG
jgi:glutathione synthase/RimK-type ligase-like ATP-grasp enzyme